MLRIYRTKRVVEILGNTVTLFRTRSVLYIKNSIENQIQAAIGFLFHACVVSRPDWGSAGKVLESRKTRRILRT